MTPPRKQTLGKFLSISTGVVVLVSGVAGALRWTRTTTESLETKAHADSTYVAKSVFAAHQADEAMIHLRDSLIADAQNARRDTILGALYRACRRKGECP